MSNPVCISPLKFYDSPAKQNHRKSYAYGHISPLITKTGWVPAFQFIIPTQLYEDGGELVSAYLYDVKTNRAVTNNIKQALVNTGFSVVNYEGYKVAIYNQKSIANILDKSKIVDGSGYSSGGTAYSIRDNWKGNFGRILLPWNDNQYITVSNTYCDGGFYAWQFDENNSPIQNSSWTGGVGTHTFERVPNAKYLGITLGPNGYLNQPLVANYGQFLIDVDSAGAPKSFADYIKEQNIGEGLYYLKLISDNGGLWTYYSEVFCFTNVTKDCLELEYWNETGNFAVKNGVIVFPVDFHFKLLLKGEIGKPEYNFEEESTKRLGYIFVESQVSKKTYKFNTVIPEYICDALRIVRLCDNKIIRYKDDEYEAITFEMETEWQTQGDLAYVTCEFETDNVVANIGGFVPDKLGGDYNNDYNEDFDKE